MELMTQMLVPCVLAGTALYGTLRRVDVYGALVRGAGQGLETLARILPALVCLLTAVSMVRASGLLEALAGCLAPVLGRLGLPSELLPLMLVRPISGSAALGVGADLINAYGPDSALGRTAAVMLGSTETTPSPSTSAPQALPAPDTPFRRPCAPILSAFWPPPLTQHISVKTDHSKLRWGSSYSRLDESDIIVPCKSFLKQLI